jgi:hypothetical protein
MVSGQLHASAYLPTGNYLPLVASSVTAGVEKIIGTSEKRKNSRLYWELNNDFCVIHSVLNDLARLHYRE